MSEENNAENKKSFQVVDRRRFDAEGRERQHEEPIAPEQAPAQQVAGATAEASSAAYAQTAQPQPSSAARPAAQAATLQGDQEIAQQFRMEEGEAPEGDVSFMSFLMSLATQALVQVGEMEPPEGMQIPVDVEAARQTIDILAMLQRKTRGNLSGDEARFLEEVVHSLRMSYVRRAK